MPEFYTIIVQKIFFLEFWEGGGRCLPCPISSSRLCSMAMVNVDNYSVSQKKSTSNPPTSHHVRKISTISQNAFYDIFSIQFGIFSLNFTRL